MYIKMDRYGKNINAYNSLPVGSKHKGNNVYYDNYENIYLEFGGIAASPIYKDYNGNIIQVSNVKIYYNMDDSTNQIGNYKVYHDFDNRVIQVNGVRF